MENLKETRNEGLIIGTLSEKNLEKVKGKIKVNGANTDCEVIKGELVVSTVNGDLKIRIYSNSITKKGENNNMYTGINKIANEYISKLEASKTGAKEDTIACKVKVGVNDYVSQNDGALKSVAQIKLVGAKRENENVQSTTDLKIVGIIRSITEEVRNEEETGRLIVEFITISFGGEAQPLTLIVGEDLASDFRNIYENGVTCELYCQMVMSHIGEKKENKEVAFGRKADVNNGFDVFEIVVVGGKAPFDEEDENSFKIETLKELMNERKIKLDALVVEAKNKDSKTKGKTGKKSGLGEKKTITDDEIPF